MLDFLKDVLANIWEKFEALYYIMSFIFMSISNLVRSIIYAVEAFRTFWDFFDGVKGGGIFSWVIPNNLFQYFIPLISIVLALGVLKFVKRVFSLA